MAIFAWKSLFSFLNICNCSSIWIFFYHAGCRHLNTNIQLYVDLQLRFKGLLLFWQKEKKRSIQVEIRWQSCPRSMLCLSNGRSRYNLAIILRNSSKMEGGYEGIPFLCKGCDIVNLEAGTYRTCNAMYLCLVAWTSMRRS